MQFAREFRTQFSDADPDVLILMAAIAKYAQNSGER